MGFDIGLYEKDGERAVIVEGHQAGSNYAIGGSTEAEMTITYNYVLLYYQHLDAEWGLRWLNGKTGSETIKRLSAAVEVMGTEQFTGSYYVLDPRRIDEWKEMKRRHGLSDDARQDTDIEAMYPALFPEALQAGLLHDTGGYWKPTPGNAGYALSVLLGWAKQYPDAVWKVD